MERTKVGCSPSGDHAGEPWEAGTPKTVPTLGQIDANVLSVVRLAVPIRE